MPDLKIGDRTVQLPELNGYKAVRALRLISEVSKCSPAVLERLADLRSEYADRNALVLTPALAKLPRFQRTIIDEDGNEHDEAVFTDADFEIAGGEIRIPQDPGVSDQIIAVFPIIFEAAEKQVIELLALLTAPNSELADADENGAVDEYLAQTSRKLLHTASLEQLVALLLAAVEIVAESIQKDGGAALERAMGVVTGSGSPQESQTATAPSTQPSSSESQEPTVGAEETLSISHHGASSGSSSSE